MVHEAKVNIIKERLIKAFHPNFLDVIDESAQHIGHAGHGGGGRHFMIIISAEAFKDIPRIEAHRKIYDLFQDMMPEQIHALRIKIV